VRACQGFHGCRDLMGAGDHGRRAPGMRVGHGAPMRRAVCCGVCLVNLTRR